MKENKWKPLWNQFTSDLDRAIGNTGFLAAVLAIAAALILAGGKELLPKGDSLKNGLAFGYHITLLQKGMKGEGIIFLLPFVSTLPFGASWLDERKNGFWKAYLPRTGKERYMLCRIGVNGFAGGLSCMLGFLLAALILALVYRPMEVMNPNPEAPSQWPVLLMGALLVFLMGAFWSGLGFLFGLLFRNRYMVCGGPFLTSYLWIILTTRYMPFAYTLNPREWFAMERYWERGAMGVAAFLAELLILVMMGEYGAFRRRLEG